MASDLCPCCLHMPRKIDAKLIWVKTVLPAPPPPVIRCVSLLKTPSSRIETSHNRIPDICVSKSTRKLRARLQIGQGDFISCALFNKRL